MLSKLRSHVRHNVVGYIAVFIALSGTAYAAKPLLTGADVQDESLTGADVLNDSLKGADVDESSLGKVGDADTLDGLDSADYGGVVLGRVNILSTQQFFTAWGAPTGTSTAAGSVNDISGVSPDHALKARDLSVKLTAPPGSGQSRGFALFAGTGVVLGCVVTADADSCTDSGPGVVPATAKFMLDRLRSHPA